MDVVYPYKSSGDDFELRYSLRSLINVPHRRVFVAGDRPSFISQEVAFISVPGSWNRYRSSTANILAAIEQEGVSEEIIVMNDDIFVLMPWVFKHEHRCSISEYLRDCKRGRYRKMILRTRDILRAHGVADPLFFGLHTPTVYNRRRLIDLIKQFSGQDYLLRTLYHNLFPAPSVRRQDVKVRHWNAQHGEGDMVSLSDGCARDIAFRSWIAARFPERSKYETSNLAVAA